MTKERVTNAFIAMKSIGISTNKVKPVLKNLLKVYDKNWELIEEENYRVLADAIFEAEEAQEAQVSEKIVNNENEDNLRTQETEEPERPLKRLRLRYQESTRGTSSNNNSSAPKFPLIVPKEEPDLFPEPLSLTKCQSQDMESSRPTLINPGGDSLAGMCQQPIGKNKGKQPMSPNSLMAHERCDPRHSINVHRSLHNASFRIESRPPSQSMQLRDGVHGSVSPISETVSSRDFPSDAMNLKEPIVDNDNDLSCRRRSISCHTLINNDPITGVSVHEPENGGKVAAISDQPSGNVEIASSPSGEVKIYLSCHLALRMPNFCLPSFEKVMKSVEDKCLRSHQISDPNFSLMNLMQETCKCVLKLGTKSTSVSTKTISVAPISNLLERYSAANSLGGDGLCVNTLDKLGDAEVILPPPDGCLGDESQSNKICYGEYGEKNGENLENDVENPNSLSLMVTEQSDLIPEKVRFFHHVDDISKGQENIMITLVNEVNEECLPSFCYITQNAVFQNAYVKFSLARIGDDNCCSTCFGDCLSLSFPCACGHASVGGFVYTADGLVTEDFLQECVSIKQDPKKHSQFFCEQCPLEKSKNKVIAEPCKGHLVRPFIKECWWKCGCDKKCGNRVLQRGIGRNLQVFMTDDGRGWGLRTLEDLPKGAFVCEYVGEVLTYVELFDRVSRSSQEEIYSYPVLLDADWGSKKRLKEEETLCFDATYYGNVARFINHRCFDSNLVEIPVEVETPDRHYYHLAFFTARKVKAMEELTWDYGINFHDNDHPFQTFRCFCNSKFCRNIKRFSRSTSASRRGRR